MVKTSDSKKSPLTFDTVEQTFSRLQQIKATSGFGTISELIRYAIESYDFGRFKSQPQVHRQISVRLPVALKQDLLRVSRQKKSQSRRIAPGCLGCTSRKNKPRFKPT